MSLIRIFVSCRTHLSKRVIAASMGLFLCSPALAAGEDKLMLDEVYCRELLSGDIQQMQIQKITMPTADSYGISDSDNRKVKDFYRLLAEKQVASAKIIADLQPKLAAADSNKLWDVMGRVQADKTDPSPAASARKAMCKDVSWVPVHTQATAVTNVLAAPKKDVPQTQTSITVMAPTPSQVGQTSELASQPNNQQPPTPHTPSTPSPTAAMAVGEALPTATENPIIAVATASTELGPVTQGTSPSVFRGNAFVLMLKSLRSFDARVGSGDNVLHIELDGSSVNVHSVVRGGTGTGRFAVSNNEELCISDMTPQGFHRMNTCFHLQQSADGRVVLASVETPYYLTVVP